ncbi:MAG: ABC transporter permease, partial [Acidobacteriales bacterium]|nr:ABC transporter permease [Terriglobales bacterium]
MPRLARRNPLAAMGAVFVIFFITCAIFAPWIAPQDPAHINLATRLARPSLAQICGSDELGRDIFSRL